jgi:hypothetical protein
MVALPNGDTDLYLQEGKLRAYSCVDLPEAEANLVAAGQQRFSTRPVYELSGGSAWTTIGCRIQEAVVRMIQSMANHRRRGCH